MEELEELIKKLHDQAIAKGEFTYKDPKTGYLVFTSEYLRKRDYCCKSGCRHCPYGFKRDTEK